jgi:chromosome segregation ATPase
MNELICESCMERDMRLVRKRDTYRTHIMAKAELSRVIAANLKEQMHFEYDHRQKQRSIDELKAKIAARKERNARLKQKLEDLSVTLVKGNRNLSLLKDKANAHLERISKMEKEMESKQRVLKGRQLEVALKTAAYRKGFL